MDGGFGRILRSAARVPTPYIGKRQRVNWKTFCEKSIG